MILACYLPFRKVLAPNSKITCLKQGSKSFFLHLLLCNQKTENAIISKRRKWLLTTFEDTCFISRLLIDNYYKKYNQSKLSSAIKFYFTYSSKDSCQFSHNSFGKNQILFLPLESKKRKRLPSRSFYPHYNSLILRAI